MRMEMLEELKAQMNMNQQMIQDTKTSFKERVMLLNNETLNVIKYLI